MRDAQILPGVVVVAGWTACFIVSSLLGASPLAVPDLIKNRTFVLFLGILGWSPERVKR